MASGRRTRKALRIREVAEQLGMSHDAVARLVHAGKIRAFNVTVRDNPSRPEYRVLEEEVDKFIESRSLWQPTMPRTSTCRRKRQIPTLDGTPDYFPDR